MARWMVAMDSVSSAGPYDVLMPMQPRPIAETSRPCLPSFRFSRLIDFSFSRKFALWSGPVAIGAQRPVPSLLDPLFELIGLFLVQGARHVFAGWCGKQVACRGSLYAALSHSGNR